MTPDIDERVKKLEGKVEKIQRELIGNIELRRTGIVNGSKGVMGAFLLIGFIFIVNAMYAYATSGRQIFESMHIIYLSGVVCVALLAYFGFIFRYAINTTISKGRFNLKTHNDENPQQTTQQGL